MNDHDYLTVLNSAQREAVTATPSNLLVLAGAGSGKTQVLVNRIVWLLQNEKLTPLNILAVTFTNKAAREMRTRLEKMLKMPLAGMWVGTFHSLAHRLLRNHWQEADLQQNFQIIDAEDQYRVINRIHKNLDLDREKWPVKQSQWFINSNKDKGVRSQNIQQGDDYFTDTLRGVYKEYEVICNNANLVDFAELLLRSHELWLHNAELLQYYQEQFKHILVDEFQDTNSIQYAWVRLLAGNSSYLTAVGDDDQSIYGWRGAKVENIYKLTKDFPELATIRLEQNYRSTGNILAAANSVIANNVSRLGKNLWTQGDKGEPLTVYSAFNEIDEARFIIEAIKRVLEQGLQRRNIAILYRSNAQSRVLEEQLLQAGINYRVYGGMKFFERAEIKDSLGYMRLMLNQEDDSALERVINLPARGIGESTLNLLRNYAKTNQLSLWQAAKKTVALEQLTARALGAVGKFLELITKMVVAVAEQPLHKQLEYVLQTSGLQDHYAKERNERGRARVENLQELIHAAQQFAEEGGDLTSFLTYAALEAGEGQEEGENDCIQLMTLHAAKGLEFKVVFICGMEAGLFPHQLSINEPGGLEEERRLCYVGMTRAMEQLYLCYAQSRRIRGHETYRQPSRFLNEIPRELIKGLDSLTRISNPVSVSSASKQVTTAKMVTASSNHTIANTGLKMGQQVRHKKFGEGVILDYEGSGDYTRIQVRFATAGTKWLVASYAKLESR